MKAVIYSRVSTDRQETGNQTDVLTAWVKNQGWELVEVYQENETAWKAGHQAELARLMDAAYKRKFDCVIIWSLDRLTREGVQSILRIYNRLLQFGVKIYSYQEPWTAVSNEFTELLLSITGWVARFESNRRSERTKAGLQHALKVGHTKAGRKISKLGRPTGSKDQNGRKRRVKRIYDIIP